MTRALKFQEAYEDGMTDGLNGNTRHWRDWIDSGYEKAYWLGQTDAKKAEPAE